MERTPVISTNVTSVGYDEQSCTLEVEFVSGGVYQYYNVLPELHAQFMQASSKGRFLHSQIKSSYAYARVS